MLQQNKLSTARNYEEYTPNIDEVVQNPLTDRNKSEFELNENDNEPPIPYDHVQDKKN